MVANRDRPFVRVCALCHLCLQLPQPGLALWDPCSRHVPDARSPVLTLPQMWTSVWILACVGMPAARTYLVPIPACVRRGSLSVPRRRAAKVLRESWRGRRASLWEDGGGRTRGAGERHIGSYQALHRLLLLPPHVTGTHKQSMCVGCIHSMCMSMLKCKHTLRSTHACFMTNTCPTVHTPWLTLMCTHIFMYMPNGISHAHMFPCAYPMGHTPSCAHPVHIQTMCRPHGTQPMCEHTCAHT